MCENRSQLSLNHFQNSSKDYNQKMNQLLARYGVRQHRPPKYIDYRTIDSRRRSYMTHGWDPRLPVSIDSLVEAGFFYIGTSDYVICFHCSGGLCNWELGDDPWIEHTKWFPDCHFVQLNKSQAFIDGCKKLRVKRPITHDLESDSQVFGNMDPNVEDENNDSLGIRAVNEWMNSENVKQLIDLNAFDVEVIKEVLSRRWRQTKQPFVSFASLYREVSQSMDTFDSFDNRRKTGYDVCGNLIPFEMSGHIGSHNEMESIDRLIQSKYGIRSHRGPKHPGYTCLESRQRSYLSDGWKPLWPVNVDSLAAAGLFSVGVMDLVKCFHCDGCFFNWEPKDDPWTEHVKWFPNCLFVKMNTRETLKIVDKNRDKQKVLNTSNDSKIDGMERISDSPIVCKICFSRELGVVFLPCGHQSCTQCTTCLTNCHICRTAIAGTVRTYF